MGGRLINEKMRIAFLSDSIYPYNKGGKETRSYELITELSKKGHDVHFYTMKFWEGNKTIKKDNITYHGICKEHPLYKGKSRNIKQAIIFGLTSFKLLKENFDIIDADHMVYFHLFPAKLTCLIKRKPLITTWHEVWGKNYWDEYLGKLGTIGHTIEKLASKLPNKIISISQHTTNNLTKQLNIPKQKITTIPCAINFTNIQNQKPSKEKSDLIYTGRLIEHKNIDTLIKTISTLKKTNPKIKCIITGDGPEKQNLIALTKKLNLQNNITFTGFIEKTKDIHSLIKSSKIFVLPSTREGFGIVVLEAYACGKPVITTNHKNNASKDLIIKNKTGNTCKPNEKDLAIKIQTILKQNTTEKIAMKKNCLDFARKYDWGKIIRKFEEVYGR